MVLPQDLDASLAGPLATWQGHLEGGRLMLQRCDACQRHIFQPRVLCPHCGGMTLSWEQASGGGAVYSTTVVSRREADGGPYNVALIDLDEGVRMMSRVETIAPAHVSIGLRVMAFIGRIDGQAAVLFRPAP